MRTGNCPVVRLAHGFTYLGLMLFMLIAGIGLAAAGLVWKTEIKREKEAQLLFVGEQYRQAIGSYYESSPSGARQFPLSLAELLKDARFPSIKRHLRQMYSDPMTGREEWGLLREQGRIVGVFSLSTQSPLKKARFIESQKDFGDATTYGAWRFAYLPAERTTPASAVVEPQPVAPVAAADMVAPAAAPPTPVAASPAAAAPPPTSSGSREACSSQLLADVAGCRRQCAQDAACYSSCASAALRRNASCLR